MCRVNVLSKLSVDMVCCYLEVDFVDCPLERRLLPRHGVHMGIEFTPTAFCLSGATFVLGEIT